MTTSIRDHYRALRGETRVRPIRAIDAFQRARDYATRNRPIQVRAPSHLGHGDVIRIGRKGERRTFVIAVVPDSDMGPPWKEHDGHGPVTDWTTRDKRPGELVLNEDGNSKRYYDYAAACALARADGWNAPPYDVPGETKRQRAARAAMADFERMQGWCDDSWSWVGVALFELPRDGEERQPGHIADAAPFGELDHWALWGIESDSPDYHETVALELAGEAA